MLIVSLLLILSADDAPLARAQLQYEQEASQCPDVAAFQASIGARLGYSPFDSTASRIAKVRIAPAGSGLKGTLELLDGKRSLGKRTFSSSTHDCQELASSLSLALAIALDPQRSEAPRPTPAPPPPPQPVVVVTPAPAPTPVPPPTTPLAIGVGLTGGLITGLGPTLTGNGGFELSLRWGRFETNLRGVGEVPSSIPGLTVGGFTGSLAACAAFPWIGVCAVGAGSVLGLTGPVERATQGVAFAGGRIVGRFEPFHSFWVLPFIEGMATLTRITALSGDDTLWSAPPFSFRAGLVIRYEFSQENPATPPKSP